ncbi:MAG: cupin domain-containing protein [Burkholderiales bacterium]
MTKTKVALSAAAIAFAGTFAVTALGQQPHVHTVTPQELKWTDTPLIAGAKVAVIEGPLDQASPFTLRLKIPAKGKIAPHFHIAIEHVTVISGTFHLGHGETFDKAKAKPLGAGSVAIMQPKTPHFGWVGKETVLQVHGVGPWTVTFVNPADDPRKK